MMLSSPIIACQGSATPVVVHLRSGQRKAMQQTRPVNSDTLAPDQRHPHDPRLPHDPRDPRGLRSAAPLLAGWLSFTAQAAAGELTPMSVPGHKQRQDLTGAVVAGDVPLYGGVDSIKHADVPLSDAEARAAALWGADWCRFSVAGSTHGNQALALAIGGGRRGSILSPLPPPSLPLGLVLAGRRPGGVRARLCPTTRR